MLALTRKTEYALIAMCHLARAGRDVVSARDMAEEHALSLPLLMNVMKTLNQGGLVRSVRGSRGGYSLARPAERISLVDLIESVEGPLRLVRCIHPPEAGEPPCELLGGCSIRQPVARVHDRLRAFLAQLTVAEISRHERYVELRRPQAFSRVLAT